MKRANEKGTLIELFKGNFAQCNFLKMKKSSVWGEHYHKQTTEFFHLLKGKIELTTAPYKSGTLVKSQFKRQMTLDGDSFVIKPYIFHKIKVLQATKCLVLYSNVFDPDDPDLYTPENL